MISLVTQLVFVAVNNPCTRQSVAQGYSLSVEPAGQLIILSFGSRCFCQCVNQLATGADSGCFLGGG